MEKDTDMERDIELKKFIMLSQGIGTIFYSTKKMGLYKLIQSYKLKVLNIFLHLVM